jgi:hypothetical protein
MDGLAKRGIANGITMRRTELVGGLGGRVGPAGRAHVRGPADGARTPLLRIVD